MRRATAAWPSPARGARRMCQPPQPCASLTSQPARSAGAVMRTGGCAMPCASRKPKKCLRIAHAAHRVGRVPISGSSAAPRLQQFGPALEAAAGDPAVDPPRCASEPQRSEHAALVVDAAACRARRSAATATQARRVSASPNRSSATTPKPSSRRGLGQHARGHGRQRPARASVQASVPAPARLLGEERARRGEGLGEAQHHRLLGLAHAAPAGGAGSGT